MNGWKNIVISITFLSFNELASPVVVAPASRGEVAEMGMSYSKV